MSKGKSILLYTDCASIGAPNQGFLRALCDAGWQVALAKPADVNPVEGAQCTLKIEQHLLSFDPSSDPARSLTDTKDPERIFSESKPALICFIDCSPISNVAAKHVAITQKIPFVVFSQDPAVIHAQRFPSCLPVVKQQFEFARDVIVSSPEKLASLNTHFGLAAGKGQVVPEVLCVEPGSTAGQSFQPVLTILERSAQPIQAPHSSASAGEAFVLRPSVIGPAWATIVLTYIRVFTAGAPVCLVIVNDPEQPGALPPAVVQRTVMSMVREVGKAAFADIVLVGSSAELAATLSRYTQVHTLPFAPDAGLSSSSALIVFRAALAGTLGQNAAVPASAAKRLMTILDYAIQPYSIGDFLFYLMGSIIAAEAAGVDKVDLFILSDISRGHADPVMRGWVTAQNHHARLMSLLPLIEFHPRFGSLFVFDSAAEMNAYLSRASRGYQLWPSAAVLQERKYMSYDILIMVKAYHERRGMIPQFKFDPYFANWAAEFFKQHADGLVPITVNLRNNPSFGGHRNYVLPAWRDFFARCQKSMPVKFIITCAASEVDPSLRHLPNVVFAKDHGTTLLQDLVLIRFAAFHIGSCSGPAAMVMFLRQPYHIFNNDMLPHLPKWQGSLILDDNGELLCSFRQPLQTLGVVSETAEGIWHQFEKIWTAKDWVDVCEKGASKARSV